VHIGGLNTSFISTALLGNWWNKNLLQPFVEARTQKAVGLNAIAMALSRCLPTLIENLREPADYKFEKISMTTGLCTASYTRDQQVHRALHKMQASMLKRGAFCSVSEGMRDVTIIVESQFQDKLRALVSSNPIYTHSNLASIEVQFGNKYTDTPGVLSTLLQRTALQNINLIEITSTYSGITLFVTESDTRLLFDTLLNSFVISKSEY